MITVAEIDRDHKADIRIPNEPFSLFGRIIPSYQNGKWEYQLVRYAPEDVSEMCFPDENYDFDSMQDCVCLGAYDNEACIGLAILQPGPFRYMHLYDLKVARKYRRQNVGRMLICGAFLFYLNSGFYIGGLDTNVYRHTGQEGKADILLYCETDQQP